MTIVLLDARSDSLTVTWPVVEGAKTYALEMKTTPSGNADDGGNFRELSSKLTQPQAKKKNLAPAQSYSFWVAPVDDDKTVGSWTTHDEPFVTLSKAENDKAMEPPTTSISGNRALAVKWKKIEEGGNGYELQMRENKGDEGWKTIAASLSGTEVKKKNLVSDYGYQKQDGEGDEDEIAFLADGIVLPENNHATPMIPARPYRTPIARG